MEDLEATSHGAGGGGGPSSPDRNHRHGAGGGSALASISEGGPDSRTGPPVISPAIPEPYLSDPFSAEPILEHLRHLDAAAATLPQLLRAADAADVHLC